MSRRFVICALCALLVSFATTLGCSSVGPRKYLFFGDPQPEKVELFEDFWSDEYGAFKPDDPELPLRRGKAGVVRFFKKNNYSRAILVDGTLTVNVYEGDEPGITMTQPDAQMVVSSEKLNESHRQFDKKNGYSYHIWLDLGEYDQPEKTYTILSIFKDAKTGEATLSKPIVIVAPGTSPEIKDEEEKSANAAEEWARQALGDDVENPIAELQKRYSVRNKQKRDEEEMNSKTRLRESIPVDASRLRADDSDDYETVDFSDLDDENNRRAGSTASLLEQTEAKSERRREELLAQLDERNAYHRERRRRNLERIENGDLDARARFDQSEALRAGQDAADALNFRDARPDYRSQTANFANQMTNRAARLSEEASEQYAQGPQGGPRADGATTLGYPNQNDVAASQARPVVREPARVAFVDENAASSANAQTSVAARIPTATTTQTTAPQRFDDGLGDFQPDANAPPTEVRVGRPPARY